MTATIEHPCNGMFRFVFSEHGTTFDVTKLLNLFRGEAHCGLSTLQLVGLGSFLLLITFAYFFFLGYTYYWYIVVPWRFLTAIWKRLVLRRSKQSFQDIMVGIPCYQIHDLVRYAVAKKTPFGIKIDEAAMKKREKISNDLLLGMIGERLQEPSCCKFGFILETEDQELVSILLERKDAQTIVATNSESERGTTIFRIQPSPPPPSSCLKQLHSLAMGWGCTAAIYLGLQQILVMSLCVFVTEALPGAFDHLVCAIGTVWLLRRPFSFGIFLAIVCAVLLSVQVILPDKQAAINLVGNKTDDPMAMVDELVVSEL